ncbi:MFS transporter [Streptomyces sp. NPDC007088]|uniref:MFS transporter n=1 Tax=Streptomyces sp. NPDC007088 TaxID=3364773 RepID=UPI0036C50198
MTTLTPGRPATVLTVLRDRPARLFLTAVVVSGFGSSALWLTAGVWVKDLTGSDSLAALCVFALWAPALAGPLLGALADRLPRKRLLVAVNLGTAALLPVLVLVDDAAGVWLLLGVLLVYGVSGVLEDAAQGALVAGTVGAELLGAFNGLRMTANEGMKLLAPLAGAGLYTVYGGRWVALLDAATFACAGLLYARAPEVPRQAAGVAARGGTTEGLRYLWRHPVLRPLVLTGAAALTAASLASSAQYGIVAALGRPAAWLGVLYAVQGAGSVLVGLLAGRLLERLGAARFAAAGTALFASGVLLRAVPSEAVVLVSALVIGAGLPCPLIAVTTAVQRLTPDGLLGRVTASAGTAVFAPNAVALGVGSALVAFLDARAQTLGCGVLALVAALVPAFAGRAGEPEGVVPAPPRSGAQTS